jgi:hypothetical protein
MILKIKEKSRKLKVKSLGLATFIVFAFSLSTAMAQEAVPATGGDASGSGGSASYSVGQVTYQTRTGTGGSLAEGVQQPYEISVVTAIEEAKGIDLMVSAYPNPTTDFLILSIDNFEIRNLSYQMFDMNGKILQNGKITDKLTNISLGNYVSAVYFLKVADANREIKTFKIIKK